jgi:hypothetical protein
MPAPLAILAVAFPGLTHGSMKFHLDLGGPTRRDVLAPANAAMREGGMTWPAIGVETGLGTGNAFNVWKRWLDAQPERRLDRA